MDGPLTLIEVLHNSNNRILKFDFFSNFSNFCKLRLCQWSQKTEISHGWSFECGQGFYTIWLKEHWSLFFSEFFKILQIKNVPVIPGDWNFTWMILWPWARFYTILIIEYWSLEFSEIFEILQIKNVPVILGNWNFTWMVQGTGSPSKSRELH